MAAGATRSIPSIARSPRSPASHRIVIPDRTGYGLSGTLERQESDFHHRAAAETFGVIEALGLERPVLWGHSDGAVIALLMALAAPQRLEALDRRGHAPVTAPSLPRARSSKR